MDLSQEDLNELARLIQEGNTGGILDGETDDGKQTRINWNLSADKWINS